MVVYLAILFAVSVPFIFLGIVRGFNIYEKKRMVDLDENINYSGDKDFSLQKPSLGQRLKNWLHDFRKNYPLIEKNLWTIAGGVVAYAFAAKINPFLIESGLLERNQVIRIAGPFIEEILKAIILVILVTREDFTIAKGVIYGFGAGIGFAVVENIEYIRPREDIAFTIAFSRVFSTNLVHATGSGLIGAALSYVKFYRAKRDYFLSLFFISAGIGLHMAFNTMVSEGTYLVVALAVGISGSLLIWLVIRVANKRHGSYAAEVITIGTARASHNEAFLVSSEDSLRRVFKEVEAEFSTNHAKLVDDFLKTQAEIITKQKVLEVSKSEKEIARLKQDLENLITHTNLVRNKLGWKCMLFVRTRYTFDEKLFKSIHDRIEEQRTGQKGGGVWASMTTKIKETKAQEEKSNP